MAEATRGANPLVIGYGNDLRSDDGAGRWVADRIDALGLEQVDVLSVSQLTPELTLALEGRPIAVFVDASVDVAVLTVERVEPGSDRPASMTHHGSPSALLSLTSTVGDPPKTVVVVSIPASNLEMGFEFSDTTRREASKAIDVIVNLVS